MTSKLIIRWFLIITSLFFLSLGLWGRVWADTYTVCPGGGCDKTTIQTALNDYDLDASDILRLQADTPGGTVTFRERAILEADDNGSGGTYLTIEGRSGDTVRISGADVVGGGGWTGPDGNGEYYIALATECKVVIVDDTPWHEGTQGALGASEWDWANVDAEDRLYMGSDPSGNTVEAGQRNQCLLLNQVAHSYVKVQNISMYGVNDSAFAIGSFVMSYIEINGCIFYYNCNRGIYFNGTGEAAAQLSHHLTVSGCTFYYNGEYDNTAGGDISSNQTYYVTIQNSTFYGSASAWGVDGILFQNGGAANVVDNCIFHDHSENGVEFKDHAQTDGEARTVVKNSTFYNYDGDDGILDAAINVQDAGDAEPSDYITIGPGNLFYDNERDIDIFDGSGPVIIESNVFRDSRDLAIWDRDDVQGGHSILNNDFIRVASDGNVDAYDYPILIYDDDCVIKNNIFYNCSEDRNEAAEACIRVDETIDESTMTIDYNQYLHPDGGTGNEFFWYEGAYKTLAQMQAAVATQCANGQEGDPLFENAAGNDFHITSDSPCVNTGTNVGLSIDYEGNPIPKCGGYDRGPYGSNCSGGYLTKGIARGVFR